MRRLTVIPVSRGINKENLTYFSANDVSLGSIIKIPVRKKIVPGIVTAGLDTVALRMPRHPAALAVLQGL